MEARPDIANVVVRRDWPQADVCSYLASMTIKWLAEVMGR
jgi:hypothetical protein